MRRFAVVALLFAAVAIPASAEESIRLSLSDAVTRARSDGTAARIAALDVDRARLKEAEARVALLPRVDGSVSDANMTLNIETFGFSLPGLPTVIGPFNIFDTHIAAAMNVIDLAARRRLAASRVATEAVSEDRRRTDAEVAAAVASLYVSLERSRSLITEIEANVGLFEHLLELALHQQLAGISTKLDTTRSRVQLSAQRQALLVARNQEDLARLALLHAIGAGLGAGLELTDNLLEKKHTAPGVDETISRAQQGRPEIEALDRRLEAARLELGAEKAGRLPTVAVQAQGGYNGNYANNLFWTRSIGAGLSIPIFTGGATRTRIAEAEIAVEELRVEKAEVERQVEEEVRRALLTLESAAGRVELAEENSKLADEELTFARDRFSQGVANDIEVDNAQTTVTNTRDSRIAALADYARAWWDLQRAAGTIDVALEAPAN